MVNKGKRLVKSRIQTTIETLELLIQQEELKVENTQQELLALQRVIKLVTRYEEMDYDVLLDILSQKSAEISQDIHAVQLLKDLEALHETPA